jgi:hypothetical protein
VRTVDDGIEIPGAVQVPLKENQPLVMFGSPAGACCILTVELAVTYSQTGLVARLPTAILATHPMVLSLLLVAAVLIVDSVAKARVGVQRRFYLGLPATKAAEDLCRSVCSPVTAGPA